MTTKSKLGQSWPTSLIQRDDKKSHATLKKLRDLPGNKECAECRASPTTWASVSLGVFVCMDCAQVHRSLGVHISKVKSCMGTYLWCPDELERMKEVGNTRAWALYTGGAKDFEIKKPAADSPQAEREQFARDKYERKRWMHPGGMAEVLKEERQRHAGAVRKKAALVQKPQPEQERATAAQVLAAVPAAPVGDLLGLGDHGSAPDPVPAAPVGDLLGLLVAPGSVAKGIHVAGPTPSVASGGTGGTQPLELRPCPQCYVGQLLASGVCANPHCFSRSAASTAAPGSAMLLGEPGFQSEGFGARPGVHAEPQRPQPQPQPLWQQPQPQSQPLWQQPQPQSQPLWQQPQPQQQQMWHQQRLPQSLWQLQPQPGQQPQQPQTRLPTEATSPFDFLSLS